MCFGANLVIAITPKSLKHLYILVRVFSRCVTCKNDSPCCLPFIVISFISLHALLVPTILYVSKYFDDIWQFLLILSTMPVARKNNDSFLCSVSVQNLSFLLMATCIIRKSSADAKDCESLAAQVKKETEKFLKNTGFSQCKTKINMNTWKLWLAPCSINVYLLYL